ncbi:MAG: hypothetical protein JNG89_18390 [Planctomycetaceae bacterium]|nr:hypothetical protein [Planctomycetaceae bacterium]
MHRNARKSLVLAFAAVAAFHAAAALAADPSELPVMFADDFESGDLSRWKATDPEAWRLAADGDRHILQQFAASKVQTEVRSPFNRAVVSGLCVGDFQFDVDVQSTARDYPHRDVCLFFGYQDPTHFYYVHLGQRADDHANQIFIVNQAPRVKISTTSSEGTPWNNDWHHVRIVRRAESGEIAVYFDSMETPVMTATDTTFQWGTVGVGTFDDTANFNNVHLRGETVDHAQN